MTEILKTVLLLALPASGKSEVRRFLSLQTPEECRARFHMGPTLQLDDYPYVHLMRRVDEVLQAAGHEGFFYHSTERPFRDAREWGTLIELLNEDHADLLAGNLSAPESAAELLLERIDRAAQRVGIAPRLGPLSGDLRRAVIDALEPEASDHHEGLLRDRRAGVDGKTLVFEFARGGPDGAELPLPAPLGYRYSVATLSDAILENAAILYIWVTPEESRRKNFARTDPNDPGSILHHGVPIEVMMKDYGCDDMDWLESQATKPATVAIETRGRTFHLPIARFDNRVDKTSFLRDDPADWSPADVTAVRDGLESALTRLLAGA